MFLNPTTVQWKPPWNSTVLTLSENPQPSVPHPVAGPAQVGSPVTLISSSSLPLMWTSTAAVVHAQHCVPSTFCTQSIRHPQWQRKDNTATERTIRKHAEVSVRERDAAEGLSLCVCVWRKLLWKIIFIHHLHWNANFLPSPFSNFVCFCESNLKDCLQYSFCPLDGMKTPNIAQSETLLPEPILNRNV